MGVARDVPDELGSQAAAAAEGFPSIPVSIVSRPGLAEAVIVRPDGYVAGRVAPEEYVRLLELLALALDSGPDRHSLRPCLPSPMRRSWLVSWCHKPVTSSWSKP